MNWVAIDMDKTNLNLLYKYETYRCFTIELAISSIEGFGGSERSWNLNPKSFSISNIMSTIRRESMPISPSRVLEVMVDVSIEKRWFKMSFNLSLMITLLSKIRSPVIFD